MTPHEHQEDPHAKTYKTDSMSSLMVTLHENNRHIDELTQKIGGLMGRMDEMMTRSAMGDTGDHQKLENMERKLEERMSKLEKRVNMLVMIMMKTMKRPAPQPQAWPQPAQAAWPQQPQAQPQQY